MITPREISILFWSVAFAAWALRNDEVRSSAVGVLRHARERVILSFIALLVVWLVASLMLLGALEVWTLLQLKEALLWFGLTAVAAALRSSTGFSDPDYAGFVRDGLTVLVLVEFIANSYTFSLPIELVLVPTLGLLGLIVAYSEANDEVSGARPPAQALLSLGGLAILAQAVTAAWTDFDSLASLDSARSLVTPIALSILFTPLLFFLSLYVRYDWLFGKLEGTESYRRRARVYLAVRIGPFPNRVLAFGRAEAFRLPGYRSVSEVRRALGNWYATSGTAKRSQPEHSGYM